jgi:hypothetical protein
MMLEDMTGMLFAMFSWIIYHWILIAILRRSIAGLGLTVGRFFYPKNPNQADGKG